VIYTLSLDATFFFLIAHHMPHVKLNAPTVLSTPRIPRLGCECTPHILPPRFGRLLPSTQHVLQQLPWDPPPPCVDLLCKLPTPNTKQLSMVCSNIKYHHSERNTPQWLHAAVPLCCLPKTCPRPRWQGLLICISTSC
jgi:hypothetical protein